MLLFVEGQFQTGNSKYKGPQGSKELWGDGIAGAREGFEQSGMTQFTFQKERLLQ